MKRSLRVRLSLSFASSAFVLSFGLAGCASRGPEPAAPPASAATPAPTEITSAPAPRRLARADVRRAVQAGLGVFLQRITLDDRPALEGGRFKGFRVVALNGDPSFWRGVDLRPGDVVMRVNEKPIERPEQALEVFHSLESAPALRVAIERQGAPVELVLPID